MTKASELRGFIDQKFVCHFFKKFLAEEAKSVESAQRMAVNRTKIRARLLYKKITEITGEEILDWSLKFDSGYFEGLVTGENGTAKITTENVNGKKRTIAKEVA